MILRNQPTNGDGADDPDAGLSRRAVVRTAAHAAWAAPVIVAASAAPAFAASGPAAVTTQMSAARAEGKLTITVTLTNANSGSAGPTTLVLTATPRGGGGLLSVTPVFVINDGWSFEGQTGNSGGRTYTFTKPEVVGDDSTTFAIEVALTPNIGGIYAGDLRAVPSVTAGVATGTAAVWV